MNVHVDACGVNLKLQEVGHLLAVGYEALEGGEDRLGEVGVFHETAVDKHELVRALASRRFGRAHKARNASQRGVDLDGYEQGVHFAAKELHDALAEVALGQVDHECGALVQGECAVGVGQGNAFELRHDVREFRLVRFQELASCRDIEEDVAHGKVGTYGAGYALLTDEARALHQDAGAQFIFFLACAQFDLRHCGNGGKCFATETHGAQAEKVVSFRYFGCGVALKTQAGVGAAHTAAVVDDLHQRFSSILHHHLNACGVCIDGIFHQFFDDGGRALYHFASGNLVGYGVGQEVYDVRHELEGYGVVKKVNAQRSAGAASASEVLQRRAPAYRRLERSASAFAAPVEYIVRRKRADVVEPCEARQEGALLGRQTDGVEGTL